MIPHLPAVRAYKRTAHLMVCRCAETEIARAATKIGGLPYLLASDRWPLCQSCRRPLGFVFQINFGDIPPGDFRIGSWNLLSFYYCLRCAPQDSRAPGGHYVALREIRRGDVLENASFALRDPDVAEPLECSVAFRPIEDLPPAETVVSILGTDERVLEDYSHHIEQLHGGNRMASKFGGYPLWLTGPPTFHCSCGATLRYLAQLQSNPKANVVWRDGGVLYLLHCPRACDPRSVGFTIQSA